MTEPTNSQDMNAAEVTHDGQAGFGWVDAHIHLDHYEMPKCEMMLQEAFAAGCEGIVAVSQNMASCETIRFIASRHIGRVMPAYGFHPEQPVPDEEAVAQLFD
nr:TatD family hydrolase [Paenibacillus kobensis]